MSVLRWLLVLPAALLGGIASTFPLHWLISAQCGRAESMVQLGDADRDNLERALTGAVVAFFFIYCGALTAPSHRRQTAYALAALIGSAHIAARLLMPGYLPGVNPWAPLPILLACAGIVGAIMAIRAKN